MTIRILSENDVKKVLPMIDAINATESGFSQLANGKTEQPLRTGVPITNNNGLSVFMPAYLQKTQDLAIKVVSIFGDNHQKNIPAINGAVLVLDATTGQVKGMMDAGFLTALRTGAVSGVAARLMSRKDASHAVVIGAGAQAGHQIEAVCAVRDIKKVTIIARNIAKGDELAKQIAGQNGIPNNVSVSNDTQSVCQTADIICLATSAKEPVLDLKAVKPGTFISAIGAHTPEMKEISNDLLAKAELIVVDQIEAALAEAGEIISAANSGAISKQKLLELGHVINNKAPIETAGINIFKSVGLAIQDVAVATLTLNNAEKMNIGTVVDF